MSQQDHNEADINDNDDTSDVFSLTAPKVISQGDYDDESSIENDGNSVSSYLSGLSSYSISQRKVPSIEEKYFGDEARLKFFSRMSFVKHQRNISCVPLKATPTKLTELYFDNEDTEEIDYPFSYARPTSRMIDFERYQNLDSHTDWDLDDTSSLGNGSTSRTRTSHSSYAEEFPEPADRFCGPLSPRTRFISNCLENNINPRASLILRKKVDTTIDLQHIGMGDKVASLLATCLAELPQVEVVNINNNNLTDLGVYDILRCVSQLATLKTLNLSRNKIDTKASDALAEYVCSPNCKLKTLIMQEADLDDFEGFRLLTCFQSNTSITALDLSQNKIGSAEARIISMGKLPICGEAFAAYLVNPSCVLRRLDLSWNMIRQKSSVYLCSALGLNKSIVDLNLSYNSLGDSGEIIGNSLMENQTLTKLDLTSCGITSHACLAIAIGAIECISLKKLCVDSNPIGAEGGNALLLVPMSVGSRITVSSKKCNIRVTRSAKDWFSLANPVGTYALDLSKFYDRAVAFAMLDMAANHCTYIIKSCEYQTTPSAKKEKLELQQIVLHNVFGLDPSQREMLHALQLIRDGNKDPSQWRAFFDEADEDGSGEIDREELTHLLTKLGFVISEGFVDEVLEHYASDSSGQMCLPGFLSFVKSQYADACNRIDEMTTIRVMALTSSNSVQYKPPRSGVLTMQLIDGLTSKSNVRIVKHGVAEIASEIGGAEKSSLLHFTMDSALFRLSEAFTVYKMLYADGANKNRCIADVLQRLNSPTEVRAFLRKTLGHFEKDMLGLRKYIGAAMGPMLGVFNGYYSLDLANPLDRHCLRQLLMHNESVMTKRKQANKCDTSQHRNWTCFRNEIKNGQPHVLDPEAYEVIPLSGKLSFDFFSIERPDVNTETVCVTDRRFAQLVSTKTDLLPAENIEAALELMDSTKRNLAKALLFPDTHSCENTKARSAAIAKEMTDFYSALPGRKAAVEAVQARLDAAAYTHHRHTPHPVVLEAPPLDDGKGNTSRKDEEEKVFAMTTNLPSPAPSSASIVDPSRMSLRGLFGTTTIPAASSRLLATIDEDKDKRIRKKTIDIHSAVPDKDEHLVRCTQCLKAIEDAFGHLWLYSRQLSALAKCFRQGHSVFAAKYSTFMVELLIVLLPRVVDLYNVGVILAALSPFEVATLTCRVGFLNLWNPMQPKNCYHLALNAWEERQVAKALLALVFVEKGGLVEYSYKASLTSPEVTTCPVTESSVMVDSLLPSNGTLFINNIYGTEDLDGAAESDHKPNPQFRRSLSALVLVDEDDMHFEDSELLKELMAEHNDIVTTREKERIIGSARIDYEEKQPELSMVNSASKKFARSLEIAAFSKSMKLALDSARAKVQTSRRESPLKDFFGSFRHGMKEGEADRATRPELWDNFLFPSISYTGNGKTTSRAGSSLPTVPGSPGKGKEAKKNGKKK